MASKLVIVGVVVLLIGLGIELTGAFLPTATASSQSESLINSAYSIDSNDYLSHNVQLSQGQKVNVSVSLENQTIFQFYIMNQSQYYVYYGCAPMCHQPLLGGNGTFWQQANETEGAFVNVTTITPASSYSGEFTAPANGTYYFVFDNTVGPTWATYVGQNASQVACNTSVIEQCLTLVSFSLSSLVPVTIHSANWLLIIPGAIILVIGGIISTLFWGSKKKSPSTGKSQLGSSPSKVPPAPST